MAGMAGLKASGNFAGHVLPGVMLCIWASLWVVELWRARGRRPHDAPLERLPFVVGLKLILPLIGVGAEWPGATWFEMDRVMSFQHVSMYGFFALSGLVDLLHRRGALPRGATYGAFAGAAINAGALFLAHGVSGGVEGTVHFLIAMSFIAAGLFALGEWLRPDLELHWVRIGAVLTVGSWFIAGAWILFRSGWDLLDATARMRSGLSFSANVLAVALLLVLVRVVCAEPGRVGVGAQGLTC